MKNHVTALCLALFVSATLAKTIPAAEPAADKKPEAVASPAAAEAQSTETPAAILVEDAEEPKQADRAKKSATTTFCVEIRPGPSDAPVKVCDDTHQHPPPPPPQPEPQVPQIHQEIHHHDYPPPPQSPPQQTYTEHEQFYVVPPNPLAVFIPNEQPSFGPCAPNLIHQQQQQHIIIPSQPAPSQHIYIPSAPAPSQQILIPTSLVSTAGGCPPCPGGGGSGGHHPHALISLYRSAMAPNDGAAAFPMDSGMSGMETMMRSNPENWINGGAASTDQLVGGTDGAERMQMLGSDSLDSPLARTFKKLHPISVGSYGGYQAQTPYIVQCNPQVLALGNGGAGGSTIVLSSGRYRDASEGSAMGNGELEAGNGEPTMAMGEPQNLGTPQGGRHLIHPMLQPIIHTTIPGSSFHGSPSVYQHSTSYQTYQSQLDPAHSHSGLHGYPGYSVHHPHSGILPPAVSPYYVRAPMHSAKTWNYQPTSVQRTSSNDMQQQQQQQQQQQFQGKSWNQQAANTERASSGMNMQQPQQSASLSPSQMLNQMRGTGGSGGAAERSGFERKSPIIMQTFPRQHDDKSCKDAVHVNMHIPAGGQPFVINGPRSGRDEQNMEMRHGGAMHDDMGKREAEKSGTSEKDE